MTSRISDIRWWDSAYEKIHAEIPKKILLKFEEHAVPTI